MPTQEPLILLVDDDPDFLEIHRNLLEHQGYRVVCCTDPEAALDHMAREKPRLVITDLMMHSLDTGFSLSRKIKDDPRYHDVPILIVTAVGARLGLDFNPRTIEDLAAMRADAFCEKPISPEALLAKVEQLLGRSTPGSG